MNELLNAAKDEAARLYGHVDFDQACAYCFAMNGRTEMISVITDRAMEIYAEKSATVIADKVFKMANDLAIAGHGDYAVKLHGIHNELIKTTKP